MHCKAMEAEEAPGMGAHGAQPSSGLNHGYGRVQVLKAVGQMPAAWPGPQGGCVRALAGGR